MTFLERNQRHGHPAPDGRDAHPLTLLSIYTSFTPRQPGIYRSSCFLLFSRLRIFSFLSPSTYRQSSRSNRRSSHRFPHRENSSTMLPGYIEHSC